MVKRENILYNARLAGAVCRYHAWPTHQKQTVADHTFHLLRIYCQIFGPPSPEVTNHIIWHDLGEIVTGDLPFPIKSQHPELKVVCAALEVEAIGKMGATVSILSLDQKLKVRIADLLEMTEFGAHELMLGNGFAKPIVDDTSFTALLLVQLLEEEDYTQLKFYLRRIQRQFDIKLKPKIGGVYAVLNKRTGGKYIGSSYDVVGRWSYHVRCLRKGTHWNTHLQASWSKSVVTDFELKLLEAVEEEEKLLEREQVWLDEAYSGSSIVYNQASSTTAPMRGKKHTLETRQKISAVLKVSNQNPEVKERRSASTRGENNPMYGQTHTVEVRAIISAAQKGKKQPLEQRKAMSKRLLGNTHRKNKKASSETKQKMSASQKRRFTDPKQREIRSARTKGENNPNYGKKPSKETRSKMRKARLENPMPRDEISGQFFTKRLDDDTKT